MPMSTRDKERLCHINHKMDDIYNHADDIYEMLVDKDFDNLKKVIDYLIEELEDIKLSIIEDI